MRRTFSERKLFPLLEATGRDLLYAVRSLRKSSGFTVTAIVILALAIGANTAMFSVLNAVLFRPLPYPSPGRLAMLWTERPSQNLREGRSAYWNVEQWRRQSKSFAEIAVFDPASVTLTNRDKAEHIGAVMASASLFRLLGVQPVAGRLFSNEEAEQRQHVAVISYSFWQSHFAGSPKAIGAKLELDGAPSDVIGILPAHFQFADWQPDIWEPMAASADWTARRASRGSGSWFVLARLRPHVTFGQAQAEMNTIARRLDGQLPLAERNLGIAVVPLNRQLTGSKARLALWLLSGAVFFVLLIAASNVASLSLARSIGRDKEIAIRTALGASYWRIMRQLLAESITLAIASGLAGLVVAFAGLRFVRAFRPGDLIGLDSVALDPRVLGWSLVLCLLTGILVGLAPALRVMRHGGGFSDQGSARGISAGPAARRVRRALVISEFALAIVLLIGAGLLVRSLWSIERVNPGFQPGQVLSMQIATPSSMPAVQRANFYSDVLEQTKSLPGVENTALIENFFVSSGVEQSVTTEGAAGVNSERLRFRNDTISDGFFTTLQTPLLKGRFFTAQDGPDSPRVAIINDAMARHLWPNLDPIGRKFNIGPGNSTDTRFTVVGVVGNMRRQGLENEAIPQMFEPLAQDPSRLATLLVRTSAGDPSTIASAVQVAVRRAGKYTPVYGITTLENLLGARLSSRRFQTLLLLSFSVIALLLAAIGIFGLIQYSVAARTHEIGVRMATGAQASDIFRMILREGLMLSITGLVIGLAGGLWLCRLGSSLLFGITATDPLTLLIVSALLVAVSLAACYFPARRAMKIEPVVALRQD